MRRLSVLVCGLLLSGCAQHLVIVAQPDPTGEPRTLERKDFKPVDSNVFAFGAAERRSVADCNTHAIDKVIVHQNVGQALATVLTLGLWMPAKIEYQCSKAVGTGVLPPDE